MEKLTLKNIGLIAVVFVIIGSWLWHQYSEQKDYSDNYLYSESAEHFLAEPEKGDLYVILNKEKEITEYFKLVWHDKNGKLGVSHGTDTTHLLTKKYNFPNWVLTVLAEDNSFEDSLVFKNVEQLSTLALDEQVKVFRQYQTQKMHLFRKIIFSPWGFLMITLISFILIWAGRSLSEFVRIAYSINKDWFEIILIAIIFYLLNPFEFSHWGFELLFCFFSIVPIYFIIKKKLKDKKQEPSEKEFSIFYRIMFLGGLIQVFAFTALSLFPLRILGNSPILTNDSYHSVASRGILFIWTAIAFGYLINNIRKYFVELKLKDKQLSITQLKAQQSKAQLDALQAKVNPHFLYNSLNSIAGLAQEDPAKTEEMAIALSHFYKQSTNRQGEHWNTIAEAIELLQTYLDIEKIRFGKRLQFDLLCSEELKEEKIPRFLLQPLVENAIKYGYQSETNSIQIRLAIAKEEDQLVIRIFDTGQAFSDNLQSGYGVQSVQKKLELLYPDRHELAFINAPEKQVMIRLN